MNKRLQMLEQMLSSGNADSFARYALAMEYKKEGRAEAALQAFDALRTLDPGYLPMYLMAGQLLIDAHRGSEARVWLEQGIALAKEKKDGKTLAELEAALEVT